MKYDPEDIYGNCVVCGSPMKGMKGSFAPIHITGKDIIFYCSDRCYEKDNLPPELHIERFQITMFKI